MNSVAQPLLEIDGLSVRFGATTVVDRLSLSIAAGEKFGLVGESGSGKSITALSVLRLVDAATTTGAIRFEGADLLQKTEREMRGLRGSQIAMIFQEPMTALDPLFTVGNQIAEVLELHEALRPNAARARTIELLARTGIPEPERRVDAYPHELSGGQRQRAMIAMALACRPKLLIADEPTTALDVTIQAQILDLLDELQREMGMALLFITHDLNLVRRFTHRVGVMERGVLVESGATAQVFAEPQHVYTRKLLASRPQRVVQTVAGSARATSTRCAAPHSACSAARRWASSANRGRARRRWAWRCWRCNRWPLVRWTLPASASTTPSGLPCARCAAACRWCSRTRSRR
jgi:microcin C transport system ATP-binding protein